MGAPYALSSDLVSAWPAKSLEVAQYIDGQLPLIAMTQNSQTGTTYTLAATDFTKLVTLSNASPVTVTVPLESSVAWVAGTQLRLMNLGAGLVTVVGAGGVTINGSPLTLEQYKQGTLTKTGTNTWTFTSAGASKILQVVNTLKTDTFSSTATSWVDVTGLSATITPLSTASKILVTANVFVAGTNVIGLNALWKMLRGSTDIGVGVGGTNNISGGYNLYNITNSVAFNAGASRTILDSPATVSATTYKIQVSKADASETIYVNRRGADGNTVGCSSLTLMEVAA